MALIRSWLTSANKPGCPFPANNLPFGVFSPDEDGARCGVAIGDQVLDVAAVDHGLEASLFDVPKWNRVMEAGRPVWSALRRRLTELLTNASHREALSPHLYPLSSVKLLMPFEARGYTDFYASRHHAFNVGSMFRGPANALPPNWLSIPIGYNGRASSVVVSGTPVRRPWGQLKSEKEELPHFAPARRFDFELELGAVVGSGSDGMISVDQADDLIFGYVLLNDWSARDIQVWEYQPLGPFQSKASATTISPWIVAKAALEPFRVWTPERERPLLPYLRENKPMNYDIDLEVELSTALSGSVVLSRTNARELYYSSAQQLCHHAICGCRMEPGDLLGSGTISGPNPQNRGSLLELSWGGTRPIKIGHGETRCFLEDGDRVTMRAVAQGNGYQIGFGECTGLVLPPQPLPIWATDTESH